MYKKFLIIFFLFFSNINISYSNDKVFYIDLDEVIAKSIFGRSVVSELNKINETNIKTLKLKEEEIKKIEEELKIKKNILNKEEFDKEVNIFNKKISDFRLEKDNLVNDFKKTQNEKIKKFFIQVNPIIQKYLEKNEITILLDRKYVFIGKDSSDITSEIIELIDKNIKK